MCGINGIFAPGNAKANVPNIKRMNDILRHRGPDGEGIYTDDNIVLGHRRLSIIDLTEAGKQPMGNEDGTVWVTFNGEIYNHLEIRGKLKSLGHKFISTTDTEILVHGYEEWGESLFNKLEGMFGLGIWDVKEKKLLLARDACGVKPVFYCANRGKVVFSSEIKGLLASGLVEKKVDKQALYDFLSLFYVPSPRTIINGVYQVPAGTYMIFQTPEKFQQVKHWDLLHSAGKTACFGSQEELEEALREEISVAVRDSLYSDVPVSLLLSSGLDSSIILHELKKFGRSDVGTVSIGFNDKSYDEGEEANRFAIENGFQNDLIMMPDTSLIGVLEELVYSLDSLNANPCIIAEHFYFKKVSEKYKVTLMGSGNDELFAGYPTYKADKYRHVFGLLPLPARKLANIFAEMLPVSDGKYSFDYFAKKFTQGSLYHREKSHYWWRTIFTDDEKGRILNSAFCDSATLMENTYHSYESLFNASNGRLNFEDQTLYADFYRFLVDNANMEVDQISMAFSLEVRPPFLTKRFAEFSFSIPFNKKLANGKTKQCLRKAYKGRLPDYITGRKKSGLVTPLHFLKEDNYRSYIEEHLYSDTMAEHFDIGEIKRLFERHLDAKDNNSFKLFSLLCFSLWHKQHMGS
ncbi:MAG: asparagine synthase (glutamine-hydrolyzing) [Nitrospinota bacterium]|nr:asparagine synthase (glutamine-hydrolyzing) [Nitrospinota bacterium]